MSENLAPRLAAPVSRTITGTPSTDTAAVEQSWATSPPFRPFAGVEQSRVGRMERPFAGVEQSWIGTPGYPFAGVEQSELWGRHGNPFAGEGAE